MKTDRPTALPAETCIMVAPFPPPVFGSAVVTAALRDALVRAGYQVCEINSISPELVQDSFWARARRRLRVTAALAAALMRRGRKSSIYISYAGGGGQVGDLLNVLLARVFQCPLIFHHHSFAYIRASRWLSRCAFALAGRRARHIFLCREMRCQAMRHYRSIRRGYVVSNAALVELPNCGGKEKGPLRRIGFFSNITLTKGIDRFLQLARSLRESGAPLDFDVAGPYRDTISRQLTERAVEEELIHYHAALSGEAKRRFFETVDLLIMPTRYPHEAEPIVVLEALAAGIPVIATDRGCIADLIADTDGLLLDPSADRLDGALQKIEAWLLDTNAFLEARQKATTRSSQLRESSQGMLKIVMSHMAWRH